MLTLTVLFVGMLLTVVVDTLRDRVRSRIAGGCQHGGAKAGEIAGGGALDEDRGGAQVGVDRLRMDGAAVDEGVAGIDRVNVGRDRADNDGTPRRAHACWFGLGGSMISTGTEEPETISPEDEISAALMFEEVPGPVLTKPPSILPPMMIAEPASGLPPRCWGTKCRSARCCRH